MNNDDVIQCKLINYTNDRYYVNKFHHQLNNIIKLQKDLMGKKI